MRYRSLFFQALFLTAIGFSLVNTGCASLGFNQDEVKAKGVVKDSEGNNLTRYSQSPNTYYPADRQYKKMTRNKMEEESELHAQAGSMWVMEGQGAYLFTQNKTRREGDLLNVQIDGASQKQVETKVSVIKKLLKQLEDEQQRQNNLNNSGGGSLADNKPTGDRAPASEPVKTEKKEEKEEPLVLDVVPTRIVERMADGNYRVKGSQPFMIGKREYKVIVTGMVRPEDFNDQAAVSSSKLLDPQYDVVSIAGVKNNDAISSEHNHLMTLASAQAARLKDIAGIRGVRENQLIGYGIVVGLKGTGDGKSEFTSKSMGRMLDKLGVKLDNGQVDSKNVAAVIVTANLPGFSKAGNAMDVTVSAIGDSTSLEGGMLLQTPMRAANEEVFAVAQGSISIGGDGKSAHTTVGRVPNGAMIERDVSADFASRKMFRLTLNNPDFITAARAALTVNRELGGKYATAKDAGTIDIITPFAYENRGVELLATIESIEVNPDNKAKVVINERTGTVIIGDKVKISKVAIAHGNLSIKVGEKKSGNGEEKVMLLDTGVSVGELVQALNKIGVTPKDLITILQSIKAAGALHGELELL